MPVFSRITLIFQQLLVATNYSFRVFLVISVLEKKQISGDISAFEAIIHKSM